jgi:glycerol uptake facilitator-like aquaporin
MVRKFAAELLGTGVLVYFAVGAATLSFGFGTIGSSFAAGVVVTSLAFGLVLLSLAYVLGPISGCHVNPAVTLGAWLSGRIPLTEAVGYWVAQFAGGILGALLLWGTFSCSPLYSRSETGLGANGYGAASHIHINVGGAFLTEVMLTALFVFAVLPGPQPRSRPHRGRDRAEPGVAVHRRAAGRRGRGGGAAPGAVPRASRRVARLRRGAGLTAGFPAHPYGIKLACERVDGYTYRSCPCWSCCQNHDWLVMTPLLAKESVPG